MRKKYYHAATPETMKKIIADGVVKRGCNKSRNRASALSEHDGNVFTDDGKPKDIIGAS